MENMIVKKINGDISYKKLDLEKTNNNLNFVEEMRGFKHLCSCCDNCNPKTCLKIFDLKKRIISEYDFITTGYQVYNSNGEVEKMYVAKCDQYVKYPTRKKIKTAEEIEKLKLLKESLKVLYFNAENIEEADNIQIELLEKGQLSVYDSRKYYK